MRTRTEISLTVALMITTLALLFLTRQLQVAWANERSLYQQLQELVSSPSP
jgi:hypothetical protein